MTTCLGKNFLIFGPPCVSFINSSQIQFVFILLSVLIFEGVIWYLIVSVPDHCLISYVFISFFLSIPCIIKSSTVNCLPFIPKTLTGDMQTVLTQRRRRTARLIRVYTVCLLKVYMQNTEKMKALARNP